MTEEPATQQLDLAVRFCPGCRVHCTAATRCSCCAGASSLPAGLTHVHWETDAVPYVARPAGTVVVEVGNPRTFFDLDRLRGAVGQRIRLNGPDPVAGVLAAVEVSGDETSARLTIRQEANGG